MRPACALFLLLLASACTLTREPPSIASATAPPAAATFTPQPAALPSATPDPAAQPSAVRHNLEAELDLERHILRARQRIDFENRGREALRGLLLQVDANRRVGVFRLERLTVEGVTIAAQPEGRTLALGLPRALAPGDSLRLELAYRLELPPIDPGSIGAHGALGHSPRQLNLGNWLPEIAPRRDGVWLAHAAGAIGEQTLQEVADYEVRLRVPDAPPGLVVIGPGRMSRPHPEVWQFEARRARDFALSLGTGLHLASAPGVDGPRIELYTFAATDATARAHALAVARDAAEAYTQRFGPLPRERLVVVEGDFADGLEFDGLVFVSHDWFTAWRGDPASYLTVITAHEIAHQWWHALVGNDPVAAPWLDEALATYSEYLYIAEHWPQLREWWWNWRVARFAPGGLVDSAVGEFRTPREYINTVYLQGARLWHALRTDLGEAEFVAWLRRYVAAGAGRIADAELLWSLLDADQRAATRATRLRFLDRPGP